MLNGVRFAPAFVFEQGLPFRRRPCIDAATCRNADANRARAR